MGDTLSSAGKRGHVLTQVLRVVIVSLALFYALQFFYIALSRIGYQFELEWFEGVMWQQTNLLLQTGQIYIEPSLDFISPIYAPLFTFLSAALSSIFGHTFVAMRLVSLLSVIGSAILIYRLVQKHSKSNFGAIISVGLYFGSYAVSGFWYDIGRVDSLQLFLMLAMLSSVLSKNKYFFYISPLLATLALFTKQSSIIVILVVGAALLYTKLSRGFYFIATSVALSTAAIVLMQIWSGGWFLYYTYELPASHPWTLRMLFDFWIFDVLGRYALAFVAIAAVCVFVIITAKKKNQSHIILFVWLVSAIGISYSSRLHEGGADNVLIPLQAALALAVGLAVGYFMQKAAASGSARDSVALNLIFTAAVLQLGFLFYLPNGRIPTEEDRVYGEKLVDFARENPGRIFFLGSPYLNDLAGKKSNAHELTIIAVINAKTARDDVKNRIMEEFQRKVVLGDFDVIVINHEIFSAFMRKLVKENYYEADRLLPEGPVFEHVSGESLRPEYLLLPKNPKDKTEESKQD